MIGWNSMQVLAIALLVLAGSAPCGAQILPVGEESPQIEQGDSDRLAVPREAGVGSIETSDLVNNEEAPRFFLKAAEAYQEGQYPASTAIYRKLIAAGFDSADLRYNLGNALLRSGELGRAIAEYRRGAVLAPRDQDVRANLAFARSTIKDLVVPPQPTPWSRTLFFWHHNLSMKETFKLLIGLGFLFWTLTAVSLVLPRWTSRWPRALLLAAVLALTMSVLLRWQSPQRVAVVLPAQTDVFSGTDLQSRVIFNLHAGTELKVTSSDETWTQFQMPDGQRGWLPTEHLEVVDPSWLY